MYIGQTLLETENEFKHRIKHTVVEILDEGFRTEDEFGNGCILRNEDVGKIIFEE